MTARWIAAALLLALPAGALAQDWKTVDDDDWCDERKWNDRWCEVREIVLPANRDVIVVDAGRNGGVEVNGWDEDEIRVRAKVQVWEVDDDEAEEVARTVEISAGDRISVRGPRPGRHDVAWSVSFRLDVPRESNLDLEAYNGGIRIEDVDGEIRFVTTNGGVRLEDLAGDVRGETRNGGVDIELSGSTWRGKGLDVETRNGGIDLDIPEDYSAELETSTVNGRIRSDLPVLIDDRHGRTLWAELGDGGPMIRLQTKNGGVRIRER
jgi:DUF4097 and DUF4098 domain-containing protein YvlB